MRISTSMTYDLGVRSINDQTAKLLHNQQMLASGRRIVTPSDDPVAAARALVVTQAKDINAQFATNQKNATGALSLEESQLSSTNDILTRIRELAVQGGDAALSAADLRSTATELRARFDELLGVANATDGNGNYIFSGYMGSTKPFGGNVDAMLATGSEVSYQGDDGQRRLQVSPTRYLEVSDSGNDVFKLIRNGNGYFATGYNGNNTGTGIIDAGNVTNPATWNGLTDKNLEIRFYQDATVTPPVTYYDLVDTTANVSLLTGAAPAVPAFPGVPAGLRVYKPNQTIDFSGLVSVPPNNVTNYGISVLVDGAPANGDKFTIAPSQNQSLFKTLSNLIGALESKLANPTPTGSAALANQIGFALTNIDQATNNVLRVRAAIGSRMNEVDTLSSSNQDVNLRYQQTLSDLQDVDYAKSISDLQQTQNGLDAAQKSFMKVTQLSLFNYL